MNSKCYIFILLTLIFIDVAGLKAQSTYRMGTLPALNINKELRNDFSINFKTESRQSFVSSTFLGESASEFQYILTELSLITSKKVGLNNKLAGGYLVRLRNGLTVHKLVQQFTIVRKYTSFRMGHRFAADQAFVANTPTQIRFRYRITSEFPLNGEAVDAREFYLKINNEYLIASQDSECDLEIRLVPLVGYVFSDNNKLEFGVDYRINSFIGMTARNSLWLTINWYLKI